jgi:DNA-dependent RNA polymerase auxiliary subunit epsilon
MSKCLLDIKLDIIDDAREKAINLGGFKEIEGQKDTLEITNAKEAAQSAKTINNGFKEDVITPSVVSKNHYFISPSDTLSQAYLDRYDAILNADATRLQQAEMERGDYTEEERGEFFQKQEGPSSVASEATLKIMKDFLNRIGVKLESLDSIVVNGVRQNANGAALIMQKLVQVVEGKEANTLPEEAMHFAVEIIEQTDPVLFKKLMNEVSGFKMLNDVFAAYSTDANYQLKDGKPNVIKIKKEAIAKILVESIINKNEGMTEKPELLAKAEGWWERIKEFFRRLIGKSGFDEAAMKIVRGESIGTADDIRANEESLYLQKTSQESIFNKLKETQSNIERRDDGLYFNDKKIVKRVSDFVKDWYARRFKNSELTKSEYAKEVDDLKAEKGKGGHADLAEAFTLFVNKDGFLRDSYLPDLGYISQLDPTDNKSYNTLRDNLQKRLESFPNGTRFLSRTTVYDGKRGIADTIDFIAITPEGKVSIIDFKFMDIDINKEKDVPWYKVAAFRQEMDQFKIILQNAYGIDPKDFEQTRTVPIRLEYTPGNAKLKVKPTLKQLEIGDPDVNMIQEDYLLPVGVESEDTGSKKINALLEKLNALYKRISETKVLQSEKIGKAEQLNTLFTAIRQLQMKKNVAPLIRQAKILNVQLQNVIDKYNKDFKGKDAKSFTEAQINEFASQIIDAENTISVYTALDTELKFLFSGRVLTDEEKELREDLRNTVDDARDLQSSLREVSDEFTNDIIAGSEDVNNLLSPEKIIKGISKLFSSTSTLQIKALQVLYKKANKAFKFAGFDTLSETKRLQEYKKEYDTWAKSKGLTAKNYFDIIKKTDKNELIDEFDPAYYSDLRSKIADKDYNWIFNNVDANAYSAHIRQKLGEELQRIADKASSRVGTQEQIDEEIAAEISYVNKLYDVSSLDSPGWFIYDEVKKFPKRELWESKEWKELTAVGNEPAKAFYDYIKERNEEYQKIGYINASEARVFLPYVRKGLIEKLVFGGNISLGEQFMRSISIDEGDVGFGQIDPLTGRTIDTIPIYFTKEIEGETSTDLFRTMALYNEMAIKYKYLNDIEDQARQLITTERNKKAIATSMFGKTQYKDGEIQYTPDNNDNTKLVEDMVKAIVYGQKYLQSETFDQILGTLGDFGERANKKMGVKIFPENLSGRQVSINKVITQINNVFQIKTLGLNILSATSNMFGGTAQSIINSGKYFTKGDYAATELWLVTNKMGGEDKQKQIAALEYFLPLTDNYNREIAKHLSINKLSQENIQEFLMFLMRNTDMHVQTVNFFSFLKNSIVQDGQVINAREYLRSTPEYKDIYKVGAEERKALEDKFEEDVKALVEEKGVMKVGSIVDGEFVIPGVERKSTGVVELGRKVQQLSKDALGGLSEDDVRMINLNIYGKSFMMFKNWIPRLVDVRMGNLKYNAASDAYEWGRMRNVFRIISEDVTGSLNNLKNSLQANENGVEFMRKLYEKKKDDYEKETGKKLEMTETEFINLTRQNIRSQMVDAIFFLSMLALVWGLKANAPDDEESPRVRNQYKFLLRAADKLKDEITYFYDPTSFSNLVSTGIFPSMGLLDNFKTLLRNFMIENYAIATGDTELEKKNYVIKYLLKTFPVTSQSAGLLPMFYPDLAKDLGMKAQSTSGFGR